MSRSIESDTSANDYTVPDLVYCSTNEDCPLSSPQCGSLLGSDGNTYGNTHCVTESECGTEVTSDGMNDVVTTVVCKAVINISY